MKKGFQSITRAIARAWFGVKASFEAVRQTWGERSWMFQTLQDSWMEIDHLSRQELQRIHGGLVENSCIVQKIRCLFLQFSVGPSGLICTPNAGSYQIETAREKASAARAAIREFVNITDYPNRKADYKAALLNFVKARGELKDVTTTVEDWNHARGLSWANWFRTPELNSDISGGQLTRQWAGLLFDTGEIFVILTEDNIANAKGVVTKRTPKVQTIDSHRCQTPGDFKHHNGNIIIDGKELNPAGKVIAYWFKKTNYESLLTAGIVGQELFDRIEAYHPKTGRKQVIHKYKIRRPGQIRGIPEGFSVYNLVRDNMDLHKLEMQAAKLASDIANVETNPTGELDATTNRKSRLQINTQNAAGTTTAKTAWADYKVSIGSKNIALREGSSLQQFMINRPTVATQDYWDLHYTLICMGYNVPKMLVMPYSLQGTVTRADLDICGFGFGRENYELIAELLREVYECQSEWSVKYDRTIDGETPEDYTAVVIRPPRAPNVDIGYTAKALEIELTLGVKTIPDVYAEKQQDFRQKTREIAEYLKFVKDLGTEFGVDPGQITSLAVNQAAQDAKGDPAENGEPEESPEASAKSLIHS